MTLARAFASSILAGLARIGRRQGGLDTIDTPGVREAPILCGQIPSSTDRDDETDNTRITSSLTASPFSIRPTRLQGFIQVRTRLTAQAHPCGCSEYVHQGICIHVSAIVSWTGSCSRHPRSTTGEYIDLDGRRDLATWRDSVCHRAMEPKCPGSFPSLLDLLCPSANRAS